MRKKKREFPLDCLYAFGLPVLISAVVFCLDNTEILPEYARIGMGHDDCFIRHNKTINMFYLYIPIFLVLFVNFIFFVITTYKIFQVQKETSFVVKGSNRKHSRTDFQRNKYLFYFSIIIRTQKPFTLQVFYLYPSLRPHEFFLDY